MAEEVVVKGVEQLEHLGQKLKAADKTLSKNLRRDLRLAAKPVTASIRASLAAGLPKRGGLARFMGTASVGVRTTLSGKNTGIRIQAQKRGHDLAGLDKGKIRHPVYGRGKWVEQDVPEGLVTKPFEAELPLLRRGVQAAMDATAHEITK